MKILHVAEGIQETCGVSCFVMESARAQIALGHEVCIVTTVTCGYPAGNLDVRLYKDPTLIDYEPDIVHIHSIWNMYVHQMAVWCRTKNIPYIISPHGSLTPWALRYKWWKKIPAMLLYQYHDLSKAAAFHITTPEEEKDVRRLRLQQPVITSPLGVNIPEKRLYAHRRNDILFLGRIHPVKNLLMLFEAWDAIPVHLKKNWRLVIAGPDDIGYKTELKAKASNLSLSVTDLESELDFGKKNATGGKEAPIEIFHEKLSNCTSDIVFTGTVYSRAKEYLFQTAKFFVLPSFSENFGVVVLEALAAETPAITTIGTPWQKISEATAEAQRCGWWITPDSKSLMSCLAEAINLSDEEYQQMSNAARQFVTNGYTWKCTAQKLTIGYRSVLNDSK